jgi:hypothetical protein
MIISFFAHAGEKGLWWLAAFAKSCWLGPKGHCNKASFTNAYVELPFSHS